jgi:hypothetical protein
MTANGDRVSFVGDENTLELVAVVQLYEYYSESHSILYFKKMNFVVCELYLKIIQS